MEAVSKDDLITILKEITERVEIGDSWEGYLNYLMPEPDETGNFEDGHDFDVEARFRVGNLDGQGGMKIIGVEMGPNLLQQQIDGLVAHNKELEAHLALCSSERSESAVYAVRLQDELSLMREERRKLIRGLQHLYQHLSTGVLGEIDTPGKSCEEVHPLIKPYLV